MEHNSCFCEKNPHPDLENNVPRNPIKYFYNLPDGGVDNNTGLILTISGYGWYPESDYECNLRDYLANKYNCIVVGVEYFGIWQKVLKLTNLKMSEEMSKLVKKVFNFSSADKYSESQLVYSVIEFARNNGIKKLPENNFLVNKGEGCYQTFGLLACLDYLQVMGEIVNKYSINKKRTYILGSSFGGYIGLMLGKLAPKSFRMIVDNSGFCSVYDPDIYCENKKYIDINGVQVNISENSLWSKYSGSDHFFDIHNREIRDVNMKEHMFDSDTFYYCAHSVNDQLASFDEKVVFKNNSFNDNVCLDAIDESKVDGAIYKDTSHGMNASLKKLFDKAYSRYSMSSIKASERTDFDMGSKYQFLCSNGYEYDIDFYNDDVRMVLHTM